MYGDHRYGHSATLVDMHPPRIVVFGGMVGGNTYSFEGGRGGNSRHTRKKSLTRGQQNLQEEPDNGVYVLECMKETWTWSKPLIKGKKRPLARSEHTATKVIKDPPTPFLLLPLWVI